MSKSDPDRWVTIEISVDGTRPGLVWQHGDASGPWGEPAISAAAGLDLLQRTFAALRDIGDNVWVLTVGEDLVVRRFAWRLLAIVADGVRGGEVQP